MEPVVTTVATYHTTDIHIILVLLLSPFGVSVNYRGETSIADAVRTWVYLNALHRRWFGVDVDQGLLSCALATSLLYLQLLLDPSDFVSIVDLVRSRLFIKRDEPVLDLTFQVVFVTLVAFF